MDIEHGLFQAATSTIVAAELFNAPAEVKEKYQELLSYTPEILEVEAETHSLVEAYIGHRILTEHYRNDMLHIALATVHGIDILVSWNFKHIVRFEKITKFNAVNLEYGHKQLAIHSPREVTTYDKN
jgi:predicted nucleic acid-binding protein